MSTSTSVNASEQTAPNDLLSMSRYRAESYLRRLGQFEVIADIYDDDEMLRGALAVTIEDFEYPDWSYKTIGDIVKKFYS